MVKEYIKEVELVAIRLAVYSMYVFKECNSSEYIMCTRLPNWQVPDVNVGMKGFLQYQIVHAGDEYTTPDGEVIKYRYSNSYFINFVNKSEMTSSNNEIAL